MSNMNTFLGAVKTGDLEKVRELLASDPALLNVRSQQNQSATLLALYFGQPAIASFLVAQGAVLDLYEASAVGQTERVAEILDAEPNLLNTFAGDGFTPLHLAAFFGNLETTALLVAKGADLHAWSQNAMANQPLHAAIAGNVTPVIQLLVENGAAVTSRSAEGWTPLHQAAQNGNLEVIRLLVAHGANPAALSDAGVTPRAVAEKSHQTAAVELLGSLGALS
jgi:uncharacterized protein